MKKLMLAVVLVAVSSGLALFGAVSVSDVKVQQRWPFNGLVDIDYTVTSDNADDDVFVYPTALETDRNIAIAPRTLTGDGVMAGFTGACVKPGTHRLTWNMPVDEPGLHSSAFKVTMHAFKGAPYLVINLAGGPDAASYPFSYSTVPPQVNKLDDTCRTTNLWLRLVLPGTFMMGSPSDEVGRVNDEDLHQVTLTKPYYIAIFETTQRQYELVMGSNPSHYKGDTRPVDQVSYDVLRGAIAGAAWPSHAQVDPESFFGKLRAKTGILFDLPTEAQWEYACRAGTSTALNSGKDATADELNKVARHSGNCKDARGGFTSYTTHTVVGLYAPNSWGLYDMHGNVSEVCLDWWTGKLGNSSVTDPRGPTSPDQSSVMPRVYRGGAYRIMINIYGENCIEPRSAYRRVHVYYGDTGTYGFRIVATPVVQ